MDSNTAVAIVFICITVIASVALYNQSQNDQTAMKAGLQECVVTLDYGVVKVWQKECK